MTTLKNPWFQHAISSTKKCKNSGDKYVPYVENCGRTTESFDSFNMHLDELMDRFSLDENHSPDVKVMKSGGKGLMDNDGHHLVNNWLVCKDCSSLEIVVDEHCGSHVCQNCGNVVESWIEEGQEWRNYQWDGNGKAKDPSRVGVPINQLLPRSSLSTQISGYGNETLRRCHRYHSMDEQERKLYQTFRWFDNQLEPASESPTSVPHATNQKIKDRTRQYYKTLADAGQGKIPSKRRNIAACYMMACKEQLPKTSVQEVAKHLDMKRKKIQKGCRQSREIFFHNQPDMYQKMKPVTAQEEVNRLASCFTGIPNNWIESAKEIIGFIQAFGCANQTAPSSLAVGCLYWIFLECNAPWSKKELAIVAQCSEVTIQKSLQAIRNSESIWNGMRKVAISTYTPITPQQSWSKS